MRRFENHRPSGHLLRVLAREATTNRILDLGCGDGRHVDALARLGFDVFACDVGDVEFARARLVGFWGPDEAKRRITHAKPTALGYPDGFFDWIVAHGSYDNVADAAELVEALEESRRVLKDGGWIYVAMNVRTAGEDAMPETLTRLFQKAGFAAAGPADEAEENGKRVLRGIFRKVDEATRV